MLNKTIYGYTIKRHLGEGGMAEVYYAENNLKKPAAVKILKKEFTSNKQIMDRFVSEAWIMVELDHPNIRKVQDIGNIDGQPAIIMEYLSGTTLKDKINNYKKIPDEKIKKYFNQCVSALAYTKTKGVVHRDIKPSNIFISNDDNVKILDFGIAKAREGISYTITGQTLGTIIYMSPEQVVDPKRVNYKTDIYSLGISFLHAITGKMPYDISTDSDFIIQKRITEENPDLTGLPQSWQNILSKCLAKDPEKRPEPEMLNFSGKIDNKADQNRDYDATQPLDIGQESSDNDSPPPPTIRTNKKYIYVIGAFIIGAILFFGIQRIKNHYNNTVPNAIKEIEKNMVYIPGGKFMMGCTSEQRDDCYDDEKPAHIVNISSFYISKYEVTQAQWKAIMGSNPSFHKNCGNCPVEEVSWNDVQRFMKKLNQKTGKRYRLPTEAEWEYASRGGGDGTKYSGSNSLSSVGWYYYNSEDKTHPVGQKKSNGNGLYDMSGNVDEWCSDWYDKNYYNNSPGSNPKGAISGSYRVYRGGSWIISAQGCRVAARSSAGPSDRIYFLGFRLAHSSK